MPIQFHRHSQRGTPTASRLELIEELQIDPDHVKKLAAAFLKGRKTKGLAGIFPVTPDDRHPSHWTRP